MGAVVRALLTFTAVAAVLLALQAWAMPYRSHHHHSAGELALLALTSVKVLAAFALAAAALYLATRPKRAFQRILLLLVALAALLGLAAHQPALVAVATADGLAALLAASMWPELGDPRASRIGWLLLCAATGMTAWLFLLQNPDRRMGFLFTLVLGMAFVAVVSGVALLDRNRPLPARRNLPAAIGLYEAHAHSGVGPFALMNDKQRFWSPEGESFLAFGCRAASAVALGPAIGAPVPAAELYEGFRAACLRRGWRPAFYQVPEQVAAQMRKAVRLGIGSEAFVELAGFGLEGPRMAKLRHDVARARREGVTVELLPEPALTPDLRAEMNGLDEAARRRQRLGTMAFSVGRPDDRPPVERSVGVARDRRGGAVAYVTWLRLPAAQTVVLDEVTRLPQAPPGTMDLLITACLQQLGADFSRASLGLAPITDASHAGQLAMVEGFLRRTLGISALAPGLYSFKAKFNPTWEQRYLVVGSLLDLPAVLVALLLLHYPELGRRLQPRTLLGLARA